MTKTVKLGLLGVFGCSRVHSSVAAPLHAPGITETNGKRFEDLMSISCPVCFWTGMMVRELTPPRWKNAQWSLAQLAA